MATAKKPAPRLRRALSVVAAVFVGSVVGAGVFGVGYSNLGSYLGSDPATCANCHVMQDHYDAWARGPHANVATCDDCHLPHDSIVAKYTVQLEDGFLHTYKFTTGDYPTTIVARQSTMDVVNAACLSCHDTMTSQIRGTMSGTSQTLTCTHCHSHIGH